MIKTLILSLIIIFLNSCQDQDSYTELNTVPYLKTLDTKTDSKDIFILSTHDIEGQIYPTIEKKTFSEKEKIFKSAGFSVIKSYLDIARKRFPNQVLLLGNGISFDTSKDIAHQIKTINSLEFDAINIVGPEVNSLIENLPLETLYEVPLFSSNIVNAANGEYFKLSNKNLVSHQILERGGVKIGIINLSDYDSITVQKKDQFKGIYYKDIVASTIREVKYLKEKNINAVVVNLNIRTNCRQKGPSFSVQKNKLKCSSKDFLLKYINRLPTKLVDLIVVSGGAEGSGVINGIPILKERTKGQYFGVARLSFDSETLSLKKNKTVLFPPLKTCHQFFAATRDCMLDTLERKVLDQREELLENSAYLTIPAMFLGHEIVKDETLEKLIYKQ